MSQHVCQSLLNESGREQRGIVAQGRPFTPVHDTHVQPGAAEGVGDRLEGGRTGHALVRDRGIDGTDPQPHF